jgi:PKHD-type hydroxylase
MLVKIPDVLNTMQLEAVCSVLQQNQFVDGKLSAGSHARDQKNNQELEADDDTLSALNNVVMTQLVQHPIYLAATLPHRIASPIYARYTKGMSYGEHIDDPVMGASYARYRSDLSITIFLNSADDYQGGELCINTPFGISEIKLPAGHALIYPSGSIHSVNPVTDGERLVAITWVQSLVRETERRQILMQLNEAKLQLENNETGQCLQSIDNSYANLMRMWSEV